MPDRSQIFVFGILAIIASFAAYAMFVPDPFGAPPAPKPDTPVGEPCKHDYDCRGVYGTCARDEGKPGFCTKRCKVPSVTAHPMLDPAKYESELLAREKADAEECPEGFSCTGMFAQGMHLSSVCMRDGLPL